jgi:hypothetical protein
VYFTKFRKFLELDELFLTSYGKPCYMELASLVQAVKTHFFFACSLKGNANMDRG